ILIHQRMVLEVIRQVRPGAHQEIEMGAFLPARQFPPVAPPLGEVRRRQEVVKLATLMFQQGYRNSLGDAWKWTRDTLERAVRDELAGGMSEQENQFLALAELEVFAARLGQRLGEMHVLLADGQGWENFGYLPTDQTDCAQWQTHIEQQ